MANPVLWTYKEQQNDQYCNSWYQEDCRWTGHAPHKPIRYRNAPYSMSSSNSTYISQNPGTCSSTWRQQTSQPGTAMIPGLFDERVHHKHRKQVNFEEWFEEDPDWLFGCICPADLCDMPCQWDEIGGCQLFRLCTIRQKYPHPLHGQRPPCNVQTRHLCDGIHNIIEPNCRSLAKQVASADSEEWQFCSYQACEYVATMSSSNTMDNDLLCRWGHDYEAARLVAVWMYWVHTALACRSGAIGKVQRRENVHAWTPTQPDIGTLHDLRILDNGAVVGFTFHGHKVVLPWDVYSYFLCRHERRALSIGYFPAASHLIEDSELSEISEEPGSTNIYQNEDASAHLRRAASWSSLITVEGNTPRPRTRSGSMSV